jgi:hypothetical protein
MEERGAHVRLGEFVPVGGSTAIAVCRFKPVVENLLIVQRSRLHQTLLSYSVHL